MFRLFLFGSKPVSETFKPTKSKQHIPGSIREQYSQFTLQTLGSGDLIGAVKLPDGEDMNEWLASNSK